MVALATESVISHYYIINNGSVENTPKAMEIRHFIAQMFPVSVMDKDSLLEWYTQIQLVHPLSDLNGRVFGIIVSILNQTRISKKL